MATRDDIMALIDQLPPDRLEGVRQMLQQQLKSKEVLSVKDPSQRAAIERMQARGNAYREQVLQRFRETATPSTIRTGGGSGFFGEHEGMPFARQGFHYWDGKALVHQMLQNFDMREIELMERLSFSEDRTSLICDLEISSGGHTVRYKESFPVEDQRS